MPRLHQSDYDVLLGPDAVLPKNDLGLTHEVVPETPVIIINLQDIIIIFNLETALGVNSHNEFYLEI